MINTLGADGTLKAHRDSAGASGTWSYQPWEFTPGKARMPTGQDDRCVVWLHWVRPGPVTDLVFVPLKVTSTSMQLSYVGRGNTVMWVRPHAGF